MSAPDSPNPPPWSSSRRILVLIAHPDDEVVGCAAAIRRARAAGAAVLGLTLTTGVPAREVLWPWSRAKHPALVQVRRDEGNAAAKMLGFEKAEFRDAPTRWLRKNLRETRALVAQQIADWRIDVVWVPAYEGGHTDHDSLNVIGASLQSDARIGVRVIEYAEYNNFGGATHSQTFLTPNGSEFVLKLTPEESEAKRKLLGTYVSAQRDVNYIKLERESFRPLAVYDYGRPAHSGTLFYQRFHWVFIPHPAIDFTPPTEACRNFVEFLKTPV